MADVVGSPPSATAMSNGIARHVEGLAFTVGLPFGFALSLIAAAAANAFHDLRRAGVEGQAGRQDDANRLLVPSASTTVWLTHLPSK